MYNGIAAMAKQVQTPPFKRAAAAPIAFEVRLYVTDYYAKSWAEQSWAHKKWDFLPCVR